MSGNLAKFPPDPAAQFARDRRVLEARLMGIQPREIAEDEGCAISEVDDAVMRQSGNVSPQFREQQMLLLLERTDKVWRSNYPNALKGSYDASVICLRTIELRGRLLGLFPPPQTEASLEKLKPRLTTTEDIRSVLDELLGKTKPTIEGEALKEDSVDG